MVQYGVSMRFINCLFIGQFKLVMVQVHVRVHVQVHVRVHV